MDKILIIDAHNAIWRAMVFFGEITAPKENVMAYNFFRNLRSTVEQFQPNKIFMVWEGHPKFRYDLYPEYKANRIVKTGSRQESVDIFTKAKSIIKPIIKQLPITSVYAQEYEADDVIATLCEQLKEEEVVVLSSDSDYTQLLQKGYENLKIYNPIKKVFLENPEYPYVIWKSLTGDKSDNIPKILSDYKTQKMLKDPDSFSKFLDLEENRANFNINMKLIEFASVPDEEINIEDGTGNFDWVKREFISLDFNKIIISWEKFKNTFDCITI